MSDGAIYRVADAVDEQTNRVEAAINRLADAVEDLAALYATANHLEEMHSDLMDTHR